MNFTFTYMLSIMLYIAGAFSSDFRIVQSGHKTDKSIKQEALQGAWELKSGAAQYTDLPTGATAITMMQDGYFTVAYFDQTTKKFIGTFGGTYTAAKGKITQQLEFNTLDSTTVGSTKTLTYSLKNGQLQVNTAGQKRNTAQTWVKTDKAGNNSPLQGTWRITGRARENGEISQMQRGPRKTLKVLTGNRFQWIAFNTETKQFSGTGGGTYAAENGKYTENIEFFSRDSERVGASLTFNYEIKEGKWHHTGQSSTGKPVNEIWEREH